MAPLSHPPRGTSLVLTGGVTSLRMSVGVASLRMSVGAHVSGRRISAHVSGCACQWASHLCACQWASRLCACQWASRLCACQWASRLCACQWASCLCACQSTLRRACDTAPDSSSEVSRLPVNANAWPSVAKGVAFALRCCKKPVARFDVGCVRRRDATSPIARCW